MAFIGEFQTLLLENPENTTSTFILDDYLNEYVPLLWPVRNKDARPIPPRGFSEKYPDNMLFGTIPFSVSEEERVVIEELDRLAAKARKLLSEPTFDKEAYVAIAIQAALVCNRHDMAESFRGILTE